MSGLSIGEMVAALSLLAFTHSAICLVGYLEGKRAKLVSQLRSAPKRHYAAASFARHLRQQEHSNN